MQLHDIYAKKENVLNHADKAEEINIRKIKERNNGSYYGYEQRLVI